MINKKFALTVSCMISIFIGLHTSVFARQSSLFSGHEQGTMVIDLIPGDADNVVRPSTGRVISVVIYGRENLDVNEINPRTIRLNGVDVLLVGKSDKSLCRQTDVNADNHIDLLCDIRTTGFRVGEGEFGVILKAATYVGESLRGEDRINVKLD